MLHATYTFLSVQTYKSTLCSCSMNRLDVIVGMRNYSSLTTEKCSSKHYECTCKRKNGKMSMSLVKRNLDRTTLTKVGGLGGASEDILSICIRRLQEIHQNQQRTRARTKETGHLYLLQMDQCASVQL